MNKFTWPFVVVVVGGLGFVVVIFALVPDNMPEARSALLGVIMTGVGGIVTAAVSLIGQQVQQTNAKVDQIVKQTNGHMTTLIAAKTQPEQADVSRETTPDTVPPEVTP